MKLTGKLKEQVEKVESKDEKKSLIENAGMLLSDDELEMVSGGMSEAQLCYKNPSGPIFGHKWVQSEEIYKCEYCEVDRTFVIYHKMTPLPKNITILDS